MCAAAAGTLADPTTSPTLPGRVTASSGVQECPLDCTCLPLAPDSLSPQSLTSILNPDPLDPDEEHAAVPVRGSMNSLAPDNSWLPMLSPHACLEPLPTLHPCSPEDRDPAGRADDDTSDRIVQAETAQDMHCGRWLRLPLSLLGCWALQSSSKATA